MFVVRTLSTRKCRPPAFVRPSNAGVSTTVREWGQSRPLPTSTAVVDHVVETTQLRGWRCLDARASAVEDHLIATRALRHVVPHREPCSRYIVDRHGGPALRPYRWGDCTVPTLIDLHSRSLIPRDRIASVRPLLCRDPGSLVCQNSRQSRCEAGEVGDKRPGTRHLRTGRPLCCCATRSRTPDVRTRHLVAACMTVLDHI